MNRVPLVIMTLTGDHVTLDPIHETTATNQITADPDFWREKEFKPFISTQNLDKKIKDDPWGLKIRSTLVNYLRKVNQYQLYNFKVHGRILYSASYLLRVQSNYVIEESRETQDEIAQAEVQDLKEISEPLDDDYGDPEADNWSGNEFFKIDPEMSSEMGVGSEENCLVSDFFDLVELCNLPFGMDKNRIDRVESNATAIQEILIETSSDGEPFLASPKRLPYQKVTFSELAQALNDVLQKSRNSLRAEHSKPKISRELPVLPANFLQKAEEERAKNEHMRKRVFERICELSQEEPVLFLNLIPEPTPLGIVRTLLSILHLTNKKKIDLFQDPTSDGSVKGILIAPAGKFDLEIVPDA